jgi:hypothetical protein
VKESPALDSEDLFIPRVDTYLIYDFRADGLHEGARHVSWANLADVLPPILARAKAEKRSVTVTDTSDFCLYQLVNGVRIFPTDEEIALARSRA